MGRTRRSLASPRLRSVAVIEPLEARALLSASSAAIALALGHKLFSPAPAVAVPVTVARPITSASRTIQAVTGITISTEVGIIKGLTPDLLPRLTATIRWGDATPVSSGDLYFDAAGRLHVRGSHSYAAAGNFVVRISVVQNPPKGSMQASRLYSIRSTARVADEPGAGGVIINPVVNQPFSGTIGAFSYSLPTPSPDDPSYLQVRWLANIDWGDGSPATAGEVQSDSTGRYHVIGEHTYRARGTFSIAVNVSQGWQPRPDAPQGTVVPLCMIIVPQLTSTAIVTAGPVG